MFGLGDNDIDEIVHLFQEFPEVEEAIIFGSRAMGNYKNGSDVDIALKGNGLSFNIISKINGFLNEETLMPYHFDVVNYHDIKNVDLVAHINRVGKLFFEKTSVVQDPSKKYGNRKI
jgi:predicted nucleotidyltransferase